MPLDAATLKPSTDHLYEYCLFYSRFKDADIHAVVEFMLIIKPKVAEAPQPSARAPGSSSNRQEEEKKGEVPVPAAAPKSEAPKTQKMLGIGFCIVPLFGDANGALPAGPKSVDLLQGSPRLLMSNRLLDNMKRGSATFSYDVVYGS